MYPSVAIWDDARLAADRAGAGLNRHDGWKSTAQWQPTRPIGSTVPRVSASSAASGIATEHTRASALRMKVRGTDHPNGAGHAQRCDLAHHTHTIPHEYIGLGAYSPRTSGMSR
jgi:hypothetical protein